MVLKLLITGAAGFIGGHFLRFWLERHPNDTVTVIDRLSYAANLSSIEDLLALPNCRFFHGDINDRGLLKAIMAQEESLRPDTVVNFAAQSHVDRSLEGPDAFLRDNLLGTGTLLELCNGGFIKRFHQVSTDEVYGDLPKDSSGLPFRETDILRPSSPYSASKAGADLQALAYARSFGAFVTVSRCSNNYGSAQFTEKLIPLVITKALADEELPVFGDGSNVRDWIHVEDHCTGIERILESGESGEIYNIGAENEIENIVLVKKILGLLGKPPSLIRYVEDRKGHDWRYAVNCDKLKKLGWNPQKDFSQGLSQTVEWYKSHEAWREALKDGSYREKNMELARRYAVK